MTPTTPPGWYDDGHGALRWWDGSQWTEHVAQPDPEASDAPTEAEIVASQLGFGDDSDARVGGGSAGQPAGAEPAAFPVYQSTPGATEQQPSSAGAPVQPGGTYPTAPYPGAAAGGGAFAAATEPRKSKLWIVWVVLGVVLLGIVIAATILIPLLVLSLTAAQSGAQTDDERAAVATVEHYDDAWQDADCDAFTTTTTEDFRVESGFTDCAAFEEDAARFDENFDEYEVQVTDVETQADEILVTTNESFVALVDENGEPADPEPGATVYHYTLVEADGEWVISSLSYE